MLAFTSYNDMVMANTLVKHKASRSWKWHANNGTHHQIDYIMLQNCFRSGTRTAKTRTFPDADVGTDHDLNFSVRLGKIKKHVNSRLKFN